jgi:hypothetical protein
MAGRGAPACAMVSANVVGGKKDSADDQALFRETIERKIRERCQGACHYCKRAYGGATGTYGTWDDLASWIFGYCSNVCRRAAGEPAEFDLEDALRVLMRDAN